MATPNSNGTRVEVPCIGEVFPSIEVTTTHGTLRLPEHFSGKWFVMFSHPGDFTPVCTTEFASFALRHEDFRKLGCEIIGLSVDQVHSHIVWTKWMKDHLNVTIDYPIIADPFGEVAMTIGAIHPASGKSAMREVLLVDPIGQVRSIIIYPKGVGRNMDELLRILRGVQIVDEHDVSLPANWPNSEFVGSDVLLHPPKDQKGAEERAGRAGCLDWWFCHERLEP